MQKTILITGATDGIGLTTAKKLAELGHDLIIHGRSESKLNNALELLKEINPSIKISSYLADLSKLDHVKQLAEDVLSNHQHIDSLINNAGVFRVPETKTDIGIDVRLVVNTIAPYLLMKKLLPIMTAESRVVNLSSAAQADVNIEALKGKANFSDDFSAYAQSKLAITMWSHYLGSSRKENEPSVIAVNPGSMLGSKMVKEGFGVAGGDLSIGANILIEAALSEKFADASGQYFDNDSKQFSISNSESKNANKAIEISKVIENLIE